MQGLSAADLLTVWEQGHRRNNGERALVILAAACPETPVEELARITVGRRDGMLLEARERTFGGELAARAKCPACAEALEFNLSAPALRSDDGRQPREPDTALSWSGPMGDEDPRQETISFRCPTAGDLAIVGDAATPEEAEETLLALCILDASDDLTADVAAAISERIAAADPQAEVLLDLSCPACGHVWQTLFDIVSFFWVELAAQARRLLLEVDALAHAYGWPEADILALSPFRREAYLQLVQG